MSFILRRRIALAAALASIPAGLACKTPPEAAGGTDAAPSIPVDYPNARPRITKDDCTRWASHGVDVVVTDWKAAASGCPASVRDPLVARLDGQRVSIENGALMVCTNHVGEAYVPREARCYLEATTARGLADCHFSPMTNPSDSNLPAELDRLRASCAAPGASSGKSS